MIIPSTIGGSYSLDFIIGSLFFYLASRKIEKYNNLKSKEHETALRQQHLLKKNNKQVMDHYEKQLTDSLKKKNL